MHKVMIASVSGALAMLLCALPAGATETLFKGYIYGTPLALYKDAPGYYDCSADVGGPARCIDNVDFIGHKFTAALIFARSKLIMVSLVCPFDQGLFTAAISTLGETFTLSAMSDGRSQLDIIKLAATATPEERASTLSHYEAGAVSGGTVTYSFFEGVDRTQRYADMASQLAALPDNVRAAEILATGKGADTTLVIRFGLPKRESAKGVSAAQRPGESF